MSRIFNFSEFVIESMKIKKQFLTEPTIDFLNSWMEGSTRALREYTRRVDSELRHFSKNLSSMKLMRGYKFKTESDLRDFFGTDLSKLKRGTKVKIKHKSPTSWTKSPTVAKQFANPKYDSLEKRWVDNTEFLDNDYEEGDLIGIGVLVFYVARPEEILVDLTNLDFYDEGEDEVVLLGGEYDVTIMSLDSYIFSIENGEVEAEVDLDIMDSEWKKERKILDYLKADIKSSYSDIENIKKMILIMDSDFAVAVLESFPMNNDLKKFISDNSKNIQKGHLKYFTISGTLDMIQSMINMFVK